MHDPALETLFFPFQNMLLDRPASGCSGAFLYARACAEVQRLIDLGPLHAWQPLYTPAQAVFALGPASLNALPADAALDYALCLPPKQKEDAQAVLARALRLLKPGGFLLAAAANDAGGRRLDSFFDALGLVDCGHTSKHKARAVWGIKRDESALGDDWLRFGGEQAVLDGAYVSMPGLFSWNEEDTASALLLNSVPALKGVGADFGCGYGYLSKALLYAHPDITLHAVDADNRAVACCAKNAPGAQMHWHDLRTPLPGDIPALDWVVMNPPFHTGKKTETDLGCDFIVAAARALKKGGRLYMVANRQLPYEAVLDRYFHTWSITVQDKGFKVIHAET